MSLFDKIKQGGEAIKLKQQMDALQKEIAKLTTEVNENGIEIIITGDQRIQELKIDGAPNRRVLEALNKALKKSQEMASKRMQEMSGGLSGLLKSLGQS